MTDETNVTHEGLSDGLQSDRFDDTEATVLLADDEPDLVALMTRQLQRAGYHVISAGDGVDAVSMANEHLPDIAVFDVQMPNMTGIEALEHLRTNPATQHIPVILISAGFQEHTVATGLAAGAEDYLRKPLTAHELTDHIRRAFARDGRPPRLFAIPSSAP